MNLSDLSSGLIVLSNKDGRIERICQQVESMQLQGALTKRDAQVIQGLLSYAIGLSLGSP